MSLDVYLTIEGSKATHNAERIMVREDEGTKQITREEWNSRFPDRDPFVVPASLEEDDTVYSANITHNLGRMADKAGIYEFLWRPDELGITQARELVEPLTDGLAKLNTDPEHFKQFNPSNGWGNYTGLCDFVARYLQACMQYPEAKVSVWR